MFKTNNETQIRYTVTNDSHLITDSYLGQYNTECGEVKHTCESSMLPLTCEKASTHEIETKKKITKHTHDYC